MKKIKLLLLLGLIACNKQAVVVDVSTKATVLKIIEAEQQTQNLHAVSFCVVKKEELVWTSATGAATNTQAATTETRFLIASISKAITAVAALQLAEANLLDLDEDINSYLPFTIYNPSFASNPITARMLLNHSSSISDDFYSVFDFYCWNEDCPTPLGAFLEDFFSVGKPFYSTSSFYAYPPGTKGNYTNMGYALLGYLVENIANQPFDEYCTQHIFSKLGMTKSEWRLRDTPLDELAIPYSPTITTSTPHYTFPDYPNGGLRSTPSDISKFLRMLMNDGFFNGNQLLTKETIDLMQQQTLTLNRGGLSFDLGLGLYYTDFKGKRLFGHGGGEQGTSTAMHFDPVSNVGVVVFTNTTSADLDLIVYSLYKFGVEQ